MTSDAGRYTAAQVRNITCVSVRQLQWWDERGILSPAKEDHRRLYESQQVFTALLFRELRERGFTLCRVRKIWQSARRQGFEAPDELHRWLLTDGVRVVFLAHPEVVIAFLEQRRYPAFVLISLAALADRIRERCVLFGRRGPGIARSASPGGEAERQERRA